MTDPDEAEQAALRAGMRNMAELMTEIGWQKRLNELTPDEALALATAAVDGFQEAMATSAPSPETDVPFG